MKKIAFTLLLIASVKANSCWSEAQGYPCCSSEKAKIYYTDKSGDWGVENNNWCGIIKTTNTTTTTATKKRPKPVSPAKISGPVPPELETIDFQPPKDFCWTKVSDGIDCCEMDENASIVYTMDGFKYVDKNGHECGITGYDASWNDRAKFASTKKQWEEFKVKWDNEYKNNFERLSVFVGEDESKVNFGWYSTTETQPKIRFGTQKDASENTVFTGTVEYYKKLKGIKYYSNKVTVTGLKRNTTYYYQRNLNGQWESEIIPFKTHDPDNFKFIFVGDPQIGGSKKHVSVADFTRPMTMEEGTRNDAFNWNMTIYKSFELAKEPSVFLSAGDQIDTECFDKYDSLLTSQETQYSAFLLPHLLKTIPSATAVGNHESYTLNYRHHYHVPNPYLTPVEQYFAPGHSYFFKYNNVLVVVLETNFGYCDDFREVLRRAHTKHPNTDWRIAMFHHDIYSKGRYHSQDIHITDVLRPCLTELFSQYKFDLVINGHDHIYSASNFVSYSDTADNKNYSVKPIQQGKVYDNPKGTFYITANCSSGSKLFNYLDQDFDYIYHVNQTYRSSFGLLDFQKDNGKVRLTISNYEVDTLRPLDGPYIIEKPEKCWTNEYPCCQTTTKVVYTDDHKWGVENNEWCGIIENDIPINNTPIVSKIESIKKCWAYAEGYLCCRTKERAAPGEHRWSVDPYNRYCGVREIGEDDP